MYYFAKEIVAFSSRDQRPSFDPEDDYVDLRSDLRSGSSRTLALFGVDDRRVPDLDEQVFKVPKLESFLDLSFESSRASPPKNPTFQI